MKLSFAEDALSDLEQLFDYIAASGGERTAKRYVDMLIAYCEGFTTFPLRGSGRDDLRPGLRVVGYRRRASIAFVVRPDEVVILRILHRGRNVERLLGGERSPM